MDAQNTSTDFQDIQWHTPARIYVISAAAVIVLVLLCAYSNSFNNEFVFDDINAIKENPSIRQFLPIKSLLMPPTNASVTARPVLNVSLAINYAIHGDAVWGYHAANLLIHIGAALVLFGLVRRTLLLNSQPQYIQSAALTLAFTIAIIWAVHPLQTSAVTYMVQRAESLMGLFYLLTVYFAVRSATSAWPVGWLSLSILACGMGMGTKEVIVSAPIMVMLYDRVFLFSSWKDALTKRKWLYIGLCATWAILFTLVWQTRFSRSAGFHLGVNFMDYAQTQFGVILNYLRLSLWPSPLILDYGIFVTRDISVIMLQALPIVMLVTASFISLLLNYRPWLGFTGVWFFAILAPSSSVMPLVTQTAAEHRMYLSLAAVVTVVVVLFYKLWHRFIVLMQKDDYPVGKLGRSTPAILVAIIVIVFANLTYLRNLDYRDIRSIWKDTVAKKPDNFRAADNLGLNYLEDGEIDEAIEQFKKAIELNPLFANPRNNLGVAYNRDKLHELALEQFNKAIELNPNYADAFNNRGSAYLGLEQFQKAIDDYTHAIELKPELGQAYLKRGFAYVQVGRDQEAVDDLTKAIGMVPEENLVLAYDERGHAYGLLGEYDKAIADHTVAIEMDDKFSQAYYNRGIIYGLKGEFEKSIDDFSKAIRLMPEHAMPYFYRGMSYYKLQKAQETLSDYNKTIELDPDGIAQVYFKRAQLYLVMQRFDEAWQDIEKYKNLGGRPNEQFMQSLIEKSGRSE